MRLAFLVRASRGGGRRPLCRGGGVHFAYRRRFVWEAIRYFGGVGRPEVAWD